MSSQQSVLALSTPTMYGSLVRRRIDRWCANLSSLSLSLFTFCHQPSPRPLTPFHFIHNHTLTTVIRKYSTKVHPFTGNFFIFFSNMIYIFFFIISQRIYLEKHHIYVYLYDFSLWLFDIFILFFFCLVEMRRMPTAYMKGKLDKQKRFLEKIMRMHAKHVRTNPPRC